MSELVHNIYGSIPSLLRESKDKRCRGFYSYPHPKGWKFCALGTLAKNAGENPVKIMFGVINRKNMRDYYGINHVNKNTHMKCSICGGRGMLFGLIAHLNDHHNLKWGKIADALEASRPYDETLSLKNKIIDTVKYYSVGFGLDRLYNKFK